MPTQYYFISFQFWYMLAKTLAEEAAWKFAKENSIDFVTLNPRYVIGPLLQPTLDETVEMILNLVNGAKTYLDAYYRLIDVRDVVVEHVQALEIPPASGRYCLVADDLHFSELLKIIHKHYPTLQLLEETSFPLCNLPLCLIEVSKTTFWLLTKLFIASNVAGEGFFGRSKSTKRTSG
ncbi:phenylacetaldehyde reductase-like [Hevea brasiliensis]|uniref:phenylacetaldehyde reductase-like n=1 Tax=Hevea brasiliensis TaxID=3981 RepID=UPI0025E9331F|nr:phenylacetaldehyde reductase-like [Hevea brasiliensis]